VSSGNISQYNDSRRATHGASAAFTQYVDRIGRGSHELRAGVQYERTSSVSLRGFPGGLKYFDFNGTPIQAHFWDGSIVRPVDWTTSLYLQDTWLVSDRLTLEPGVRAAFYDSALPDPDASVYTSRSISPRLGAAWDLAPDHRTVIRAHYGWYHDPMVNSFYWYLDANGCSAPTIVADVVGPGQFRELFTSGGCLGRIDNDPNVRHSYVEEFVSGLERDLFSRLSLRVQYVRRSFRNLVGYVDIGPSHWIPVSVMDPGPDGTSGTADDRGPLTIYHDARPQDAFKLLTNPPGAWRHYDGFQLIGLRQYAGVWQLQASYTWSRTRGSVNNEFGSSAASGDLGANGNWVNPNRMLFSNGRTTQDYTHDLKILGTYLVPWWGGVRVSGICRYTSGQPWARGVDFGSRTGLCCGFLSVEPIGARELPATNSADVRVEKTLPAGRRTMLGIYLDVFNVNNQGIAQRVNAQSGPNFAVPVSWSPPRALRVGARVSF
jgi:hypothetical protein